MDMPVENIRNRINSFMPPNPSKNLFFDLYPKESFCSSVRIAMKDTVDNNINREKERKKVMEEQNAGKTIFNNIGDLGLGEGASITEIVRRMPTNSTLCQVQGNFNQPISDTPVPYGVLTIVKTTDYFVQIIFTRMTVGNTPQIYQAQWKDNRVYSWSRFVSEEDLIAFKEEIREELDSIKNNIPIF